MQYILVDLLLFFILYGFCGFLMEMAFRSYINRKLTIQGGFLTNYFCPLYGVCALVIVQIYTLSDITFNSRFISLLAATLGSALAVTFFEYAAGRVLDKVFHHKMWDYSNNAFNLHSYICLEFSLIWGIVALLLSGFIHPVTEILIMPIPVSIKYMSITSIFSMLFVNAAFNARRLFYTSKTIKL